MYHISDWNNFSEWELELYEMYYEAIISVRKNLTPIFKVRVVPKTEKIYNLIIRDYKTGTLVFKKEIPMTEFDKSFTENTKNKKIVAELINKAVKDILLSE